MSLAVDWTSARRSRSVRITRCRGARAVKQAVDIPVIAVGLITEAQRAEAIVATGDADMIAVARTILYDPRWPWHVAAELGASVTAAPQYLRC